MNKQDQHREDPKAAVVHRLRTGLFNRSHPTNFDTVQWMGVQVLPSHQLHHVTVQEVSGQRWHFICFLKQRTNGSWQVKFNRGYPEHSFEKYVAPETTQDVPEIRLQVGENSLHEFLTGGIVIDKGFHVTSVHLVSRNGQVLQDTVHEGLVLYWTDKEVFLPLQAELYNASDEIIGRHTVLNEPTYGI